MPFDSLPDRDKAALETPSAANLAHILRNKVLWPDGFHWFYPHGDTCAIGLCRALWDMAGYETVKAELSADNAFTAFTATHMVMGIDGWADVQPEHVAEVIEGYLTK